MTLVIVIGIALLVGFVIHLFNKYFKFPKVNSMVCVTGGVKSGKSTFSFALAYSTYKRALRSVKFRNFFHKIFSQPLEEEPLFYTTIPVSVPHVLLTRELLLREKRFAYKSVIWVDEASILCDSMSYKDLDINDKLLLFNKLIAHETKGGTIVYNTQSVADMHYSVKRCLSETFYVHETYKWLPFFLICTVREERYSEDGMAMNTYETDVEDTLKRVIIPKSVWKMFDCYAYSSMTDNKPVHAELNKPTSLKASSVLSFNERHNIRMEDENNEKKVD